MNQNELFSWENTYKLFLEFVDRNNRLPKKDEKYFDVDLERWLEEQLSDDTLAFENKKKIYAIIFSLKGKNGHSWWKMYEVLCDYVERYKTTPKKMTVYKESNLGSWLWTQKRANAKGKLSEVKFFLLKAKDVDLEVSKRTSNSFAETHKKYDKLKKKYFEQYKKEPVAGTLYYNKNLGYYHTKLLKYDAVGRNPEDPVVRNPRTWEASYKLVEEYLCEKKRWPKPEEVYSGAPIGNWIILQRQYKKNNMLSEERIQALEKIGFKFDPREDAWQENYKVYKKYKEEKKEEPRYDTIYEDVKLGQWYYSQRQFYNRLDKNQKRRMSEEHIKRFIDAGAEFVKEKI